MDSLSKEDRWVNSLHPLVKLGLTVLFIVLTVSCSKYDFSRLLLMAVYPAAMFILGELSFTDALQRLRFVLPVVCAVGILNPLFDRQIVLTLGSVALSGGVLSMLTLMLKAVLTVLAGYLLIATTGIEKICGALRAIHVPALFVTEILLIYRYVLVLLAEAKRVTQAYSLRAPGQKGIEFKAWGSLLGQLLLRSMDRADRLYGSMLLRGFHGEYPGAAERKPDRRDLLFFAVWTLLLFLLRCFPLG